MASSIVAELWDAVSEQLLDEGIELGDSITAAMVGPDGEAPGDHRLSPAERIARFQDMAQRGVLDALESICAASGASHYDDLVKAYVEDVAASRLVGGG